MREMTFGRMTKLSKDNKTNYNKVEVKNNMKVDNNNLEVEERKSLDKVVSAEPVKVKKGLMSRLVTGVLGPEGLPGIGQYVSEEIIIPAIKNIIVDAVTSGINMVMYGENRPHNPRAVNRQPANRYYSSGPRPTYNYTSRYTSQQPDPKERHAPRANRYGIEEYVIENREDAAHVLTTLTEQADMYGSVSVADYYDLIGVTSEYTDNNYGWILETIVRATIRPVRGGYIIALPAVDVI